MNTTLRQITLAKRASKEVAQLSDHAVSRMLLDLVKAIDNGCDKILRANKRDAIKMRSDDPKLQRLLLDKGKITGIAQGIREVSKLPSPLGKILEQRTLSNGLKLFRVSVPLGVVGVVYEARPNVTPDIFSLCIKSGNACVLKGGQDAQNSHQALVAIIKKVLVQHHISQNCIQLLPSDRQAVGDLLNAKGLVDMVVARGSRQLIDFVRDHAKVPFIETGAGVVHAYFDQGANVEQAKKVIANSKVSRPAVCNALDTLIVHQAELENLPRLVSLLAEYKVELYADRLAHKALEGKYSKKLLKSAKARHFDTEFLSFKMAIKTVTNLDQAMAHIATHGTGHTEVILSRSQINIDKFLAQVDAAAVYANCATVFTDGGQYGLGAEVGISTQKFHARGPMGLSALTSYKWILRGSGQVRK